MKNKTNQHLLASEKKEVQYTICEICKKSGGTLIKIVPRTKKCDAQYVHQKCLRGVV